MSTKSTQPMNKSFAAKKSLVLIGSLVVCGSAILGLSSRAFALDVKAGPIWNNDDAKVKCPVACAAVGGKWDGNWRTTVWGKESVCSCK
ncbi:MAG: mannan-binding lectin [Nostoc sp. S4]|nr:mannan-binding lectin [Nostoc sp. S4]